MRQLCKGKKKTPGSPIKSGMTEWEVGDDDKEILRQVLRFAQDKLRIVDVH